MEETKNNIEKYLKLNEDVKEVLEGFKDNSKELISFIKRRFSASKYKIDNLQLEYNDGEYVIYLLDVVDGLENIIIKIELNDNLKIKSDEIIKVENIICYHSKENNDEYLIPYYDEMVMVMDNIGMLKNISSIDNTIFLLEEKQKELKRTIENNNKKLRVFKGKIDSFFALEYYEVTYEKISNKGALIKTLVRREQYQKMERDEKISIKKAEKKDFSIR
jgi:hypothetical protein